MKCCYASAADTVELKNFGVSSQDVSGYYFCSLFSYTAVSSLTVVSGSTNLAPDSILVLTGFSLNNIQADLGLYANNLDFESTITMRDFVQWGAPGLGRESVAVAKGIWTLSDFVPVVTTGHSIEFIGSGQVSVSGDWQDQPVPTFGMENGLLTSVDTRVKSSPQQFYLHANYPNPFNPSTTLSYELRTVQPVVLAVYNLLGERIRVLIDAVESPGLKSVLWDGTNSAGKQVSSGTYLSVLRVGGQVSTRKLLLLK